jgi:hypothetical protein
MKPMTYAVRDYDALDPFKRRAARRARPPMLRRLGVSEVEMSRGESAYLIETPDSFLAHVEEGLGTKNLIADAITVSFPSARFTTTSPRTPWR